MLEGWLLDFLLKGASSTLILQLWAALAGKLSVQHSLFRAAQTGDFLQEVSSQRATGATMPRTFKTESAIGICATGAQAPCKAAATHTNRRASGEALALR